MIGDFGLAQTIEFSKQTVLVKGGTFGYLAPEMYNKQTIKNSKSCDVFSLGVIFYRMLTKKYPFGSKAEKFLKKVES